MISKLFNLNPRKRLQQHIRYLSDHIKIESKKDKEIFASVKSSFDATAKKLARYQTARVLIFILLYFSVVGTIAKSLELNVLREFLRPIAAIAGLVGASVLTLLLLGVNYIITVLLTDLMMEHSHLVAILVKNNSTFVPHPEYSMHIIKTYPHSPKPKVSKKSTHR